MKNTLIKASAGTGKTFALATRFIRLMLLGVGPQEIVALTFSRAAAGEIYNKIASRLADAAKNDAGAEKETANIHRELDATLGAKIDGVHGRPIPRAVFIQLLRQLIAAQHVSMIGTIDSFMMRMARSFPLELGLQSNMAILDDYQAARERDLVVSRLLNADASANLHNAFQLAFAKKPAKTYEAALRDFIRKHHAAFVNNPGEKCWGNKRVIWPAGEIFMREGSLAELAGQLRENPPEKLVDKWNDLCDQVRDFNGSFSPAPLGTFAKNLFDPDAKSIYRGMDVGLATKELLRRVFGAIFAGVLDDACMRTRGVYTLMRQFENFYAASVRKRGRLVFDDIPRLIRALPQNIRQNIEYRFDTRFAHWALDEFQDTSRTQWDAIHNLLDEIIQSQEGGRSLFIVGDMKQAIYGWRAGDIRIFREQAESNKYDIAQLDASFRYCPEITRLVNRVFEADGIVSFLGDEGRGAGLHWQQLWREHRTEKRGAGFVSVERVREFKGKADETDAYASAILARLLGAKPWERGKSCAILVRANSDGKALAAALRRHGIKVVFEGESAIVDTPVVTALLHLLQCAAHPADTLAWQHVCMSPLRDALGLTHYNLSDRILSDVSRLGLPRALQTYAAALPGNDEPFTRARLNDLIRAAFKFTSDPNATPGDFADFVETFKARDAAGNDAVKILTIHRSKGLDFDCVFLPVIEGDGFTTTSLRGMLVDPRKKWLLEPPASVVLQADPVLRAAADHAANDEIYESLCAWYVAFTRAKETLSVFLHPCATKTKRLADHIATVLQTLPYEEGVRGERTFLSVSPRLNGQECPFSLKRAPRVLVQRVTPSAGIEDGHSAAGLFATGFSAAERGNEEHARLQKIEWLDDLPASEVPDYLRAPSQLRDALCKPAGLVDLWRERGFEILHEGKWISGVFDRVVFLEDGVELYDFKTNRKQSGETDAEFTARMARDYAPQMRNYRLALSRLCNLPASAIHARLLLTETRVMVNVALD